MLTVHHLSKAFDSHVLFEDVSFSVNPNERVALIGPNGCGKTTLIRILLGEEQASSGEIHRPSEMRIGYLPQGFTLDPELTVGQITAQASGSIYALEDKLEEIASKMASDPDDLPLQAEYDDLLRRIEAADTRSVARVLSGLGLRSVDPNLPAGKLSGGQKTRLALALVLLSQPDLLLLDEPTNHLDIAMLEWLEDWLTSCPCAVLFISHDRTFLDRTSTAILEIDPLLKTARQYPGNYTSYLERRELEIEKQWAAYEDQQEEIRRMREDIARTKAQAAHTENQTRSARIGGREMRAKGVKDHLRGRAVKVARKAKAREKRLERYLQSDDRVEKPLEASSIHLAFQAGSHLGQSVLTMQDLAVGFSQYAPLLSGLNLHVRAGERIVLTGCNGSGKTSLLRTLLGELPALGGSFQLGSSVHLGYMAQEQTGLDLSATAVESLAPYYASETKIRSFLAPFGFSGDEPLKPARLLSFGQRARLMLAQLVAKQCNFLLLDEPINHLDIQSREQFEAALSGFDGAVLAVVHDRTFIQRFADTIWELEGKSIQVSQPVFELDMNFSSTCKPSFQ